MAPEGLVNVKGKKTVTGQRALLDLGSQRTFMTTQLAKLLDIKPIRSTILAINGFSSK